MQHMNRNVMRHKHRVLQTFKEFIAECSTPLILRCDNGIGFTSTNFRKFLYQQQSQAREHES